jgi:hypothetical protein
MFSPLQEVNWHKHVGVNPIKIEEKMGGRDLFLLNPPE